MYFIAIVLPVELDKKILLYKKWLAEKYDAKVGLKSPAHVTLVPPFRMEEEKQQALISDMEVLCTGTASFHIATNNFSSFAPRTLFIAVEANDTLHKLKKTVDDYFRNRTYKIKMDARPFYPHITIATRDVHRKDFWEAWEHFRNKQFGEEFTATGISLLKHNGNTWDVVYSSNFIPV